MAEIKIFKSGVVNRLSDEDISSDAASDSKNWKTEDGKIQLVGGREIVGAEGAVGKIYGEIFGYKVNGTTVHWRKAGTKIQYLNGTTWTDVVTGLTETADYFFSNYSSLAGSFTFAFGVDGIFKFHNANPASYLAMYSSAINFKGLAFIDKGRTILWDRNEDKTGLYGSAIDGQTSGVEYTTVTGEILGASGATTYTGTLAQRTGTRNAFAIAVSGITGAGTETFTDNYLGVLTGNLGGTGTINYLTGAYSVTFNGVVTSGNVTANYIYEDSNNGGITDFRHTAVRIASEGFQFPQDEGGDPIMTVLVGLDDAYYSIKRNSIYRLSIDSTDLIADNNVFRRNIGIPSKRAAVATSKGIVFMNTANVGDPRMTILQKNVLDNIEPTELFPHFDFSKYIYDDCFLDTHDRFVLVGCKGDGATNNDTLLLCDVELKTVDITGYSARVSAKDAGILYAGSPISETVYKLFEGTDDNGFTIENYWSSKADTFGTNRLKKYRKLRLKGTIDLQQYYEVYAEYDNSGFALIGTIRGNQTYVDTTDSGSVGTTMVGEEMVGGEDSGVPNEYFAELKMKTPKFRSRKLKFVAKGYGHIDVEYLEDFDFFTFEERLPKKYRQKQNVDLSGTLTDQ